MRRDITALLNPWLAKQPNANVLYTVQVYVCMSMGELLVGVLECVGECAVVLCSSNKIKWDEKAEF